MVVYGIDLGTCYSCIARNDCAGSVTPVELFEAEGKKFITSVVTFDKKTGKFRTTEEFNLKWKLLKAKYPEYTFKLV